MAKESTNCPLKSYELFYCSLSYKYDINQSFTPIWFPSCRPTIPVARTANMRVGRWTFSWNKTRILVFLGPCRRFHRLLLRTWTQPASICTSPRREDNWRSLSNCQEGLWWWDCSWLQGDYWIMKKYTRGGLRFERRWQLQFLLMARWCNLQCPKCCCI